MTYKCWIEEDPETLDEIETATYEYEGDAAEYFLERLNSSGYWDGEDVPYILDVCVKGAEGVLNGNTPEQSHQCWLKEKEETGWKYGPIKNSQTKEHPCFLPYSELPQEQKQKDHIFVSVVRAMYDALRNI